MQFVWLKLNQTTPLLTGSKKYYFISKNIDWKLKLVEIFIQKSLFVNNSLYIYNDENGI